MAGLFELSMKNKYIIYFDEFQRFEDINKSLFTSMEKNIDLYLSNSKLSIVCSGSSIGLMKRLFPDINLPLYKRSTSIMNLKNFDFITSFKVLKINIEDSIKMYSIFGGSPQFYKYFYKNNLKNVEEMIKDIFSYNSVYIYEPRDFLMEGFGSGSQTYFSILYAISTGKEFLIYLNNEKQYYLPFNIQKIGKWWGKNKSKSESNNQEDIAIVAINDNTMDIIFSECKWKNKPVDVDVYNNIKRKLELVLWNNDKRKEHFVLFSKSGFTDNMKDIAKINNIILFDLEKMQGIIEN